MEVADFLAMEQQRAGRVCSRNERRRGLDDPTTLMSYIALPSTPLCNPKNTYGISKDVYRQYELMLQGLCLWEGVGLLKNARNEKRAQ